MNTHVGLVLGGLAVILAAIALRGTLGAWFLVVMIAGITAIVLGFIGLVVEWLRRQRLRMIVQPPIVWKPITIPASPLKDSPPTADDLGPQVAALMGMRLDEYPAIRARAAILFAGFKLNAAERYVLIIWANFALTGGELDYHVEPYIRLQEQYWRLQCSDINQYPRRRLDGQITASDRETLDRLVATHRMMVNQLRLTKAGY